MSVECMGTIPNNATYMIQPGQHFKLKLPDGTELTVECTQDDFSINREDGTVAYTKAISSTAKFSDSDMAVTTGRG